jgi:hypothetical protein
VQFVGEELNGMVIMTQQLVVSIDLVGESALLSDLISTAPSLISSTGVSQ